MQASGHRSKETIVQGTVSKQASFDLVSRSKPSLEPTLPVYSNSPTSELPDYRHPGKSLGPLPHRKRQAARSTQFHDSAKLSSGSSKVDKPPEKEVRLFQTAREHRRIDAVLTYSLQSCEMLLDGLPANLVRTLPKPDPAQHHLLAVRVKQDDALTKCLDSADMGPKPGFLGHPIVAGDWHGVLCTVAPAPDRPEDLPEVFQLYGKVTWGELLEHLYHLWPPGDCRDLAEEDDYEPTLYYFYYDVEISFLKGEQVV